MNIFHYDNTGKFTGSSIADESPLEPGVFLLPANATFTPIPALNEGQRAVWNGTVWDIEAIPEPTPEPVYVPTTEELWSHLRAERNQLLSDTDYFANTDVTMPDAMRTYRQALRDLPANTTDPANPVWPSKPNV